MPFSNFQVCLCKHNDARSPIHRNCLNFATEQSIVNVHKLLRIVEILTFTPLSTNHIKGKNSIRYKRLFITTINACMPLLGRTDLADCVEIKVSIYVLINKVVISLGFQLCSACYRTSHTKQYMMLICSMFQL